MQMSLKKSMKDTEKLSQDDSERDGFSFPRQRQNLRLLEIAGVD